jgi:Fis family transcriptional regulator
LEPNVGQSEHLFVANLKSVSLEKLVKSKLEVLFKQREEAQVDLQGLYSIVIEQVEKPLIELSLSAFNGNQVKTAKMLGINRNTLKKKIDNYRIPLKNKVNF